MKIVVANDVDSGDDKPLGMVLVTGNPSSCIAAHLPSGMIASKPFKCGS